MERKAVFLICVLSFCFGVDAATLYYDSDAPNAGLEDIAQLDSPSSDTKNILGQGITSSAENDSATYVAGDRTTQGQTFTTNSGDVTTLEGVWIRHVGYTNYLDNGTWASLNDGEQITLRICSVSGTSLTVLRSEIVTVNTGSGFSGGGNWNGTGRWLYIDLGSPVDLSADTEYAFDLTSYGPWFELAGLDDGSYSGGTAYTTGSDEALDLGTVYTNGDRTFVADMSPAGFDVPGEVEYQISIEAITDRIIHVHCVPEGQAERASLIVPDITRDPVSVVVDDNQDAYSLTTSQIKAVLDKTTSQVSFYTLADELILAEDSRSIIAYNHQESTGGVQWVLNRTAQSWVADENENYYGLGQKPGAPINYQGINTTIEQGNTDAMTPFIVSSGEYGILWDMNCTGSFNAADTGGIISFTADAAFGMDYYFIYGPDFEGVINEYRELTGPAPMYPKWGFGFWQSKCQYNNQNELLDIANDFRNHGFPIDLIIQDWKYWGYDNNYWSSMTWDSSRYPDPDSMIDQVHDLNMKFMAVIWPFIGPASDLGVELESNGGLLQGGNNYTGQVARLFDAYDPAIYDIYWDHADSGLFQRGLDGWWMDASEPEDIANLSGDTGYGPLHSCHNAYALVHTQGLSQRQLQVNDQKRVVMLTRSCWAGQQRTGGATWSGDTQSNWSTFRDQITAGISYCMSGLPYWTTDIGGYWGSDNQNADFRELFQRWFQYGTFCPLYRVHGFADREPWQWENGEGPIFNNMKKYADLRYRLMPYIYTLGSEVTRNNTTIMRGLPMDFPDDHNCQNNGQEFMFGPAFLVRPVTEAISTSPQQTVVYLPQGESWYDFWTGQLYEGSQTLVKETPIDVMPLYVKAGSIVPMGPILEWATQNPADPIELRIYTGADSVFILYEDENDNYNYKNGEFSQISFFWNETEKKLTIGDRQGSFPGMLTNRTVNIVFVSEGHGTGMPETAEPDVSVSYTGQAITINQPGVCTLSSEAIGFDTDDNCMIDMVDFAMFAEFWLEGNPDYN